MNTQPRRTSRIFSAALHRPAPHDAPRNSWRGGPLDTRDALLREHLAAIEGRVNQPAVLETWERLRATTQRADETDVNRCFRGWRHGTSLHFRSEEIRTRAPPDADS